MPSRHRPGPFDHVLVATDFSEGGARAVARAGRLPLAERGKVTVVYVLSDRIPKKARASTEKLARRQLERQAQSITKAAAASGRHDVQVSICRGQAYVEIIRRARAVAADLIVVGRHGYRPLRGLGLEWQTVVVRGDPRSVVLTEAARRRADLLAVGTHARSGIAHALVGSVAEWVVRGATCDVLVARPARVSFELP